MAGPNTIEFTDENFATEVLESDQPVLVDFWAEWCGPCKMLAPTIDELAEDFAGKAKVGKVETDNNKDVAMKYGISALPTVLIFKGGEVKETIVGLRGKADLAQALENA